MLYIATVAWWVLLVVATDLRRLVQPSVRVLAVTDVWIYRFGVMRVVETVEEVHLADVKT